MNLINQVQDANAGIIKDIAVGPFLLSVVSALIVGMIIFIPKVKVLL
jgi:diacylglycerol kinase